MTVASRVAVPVTPLSHGPQSGTTTGPAWPGGAMWTWAATAAPVSPLNTSRQAIVAPAPERVTVAVNVPRADATLPVGAGTSCAAVIAPTMLTLFAWLRPAAPPTATGAAVSATTPMVAAR